MESKLTRAFISLVILIYRHRDKVLWCWERKVDVVGMKRCGITTMMAVVVREDDYVCDEGDDNGMRVCFYSCMCVYLSIGLLV